MLLLKSVHVQSAISGEVSLQSVTSLDSEVILTADGVVLPESRS